MLKDQCKCLHQNTTQNLNFAGPPIQPPQPPPCLPPPPPPPLPPPPPPLPPQLLKTNSTSLKITKKVTKSGDSEKENSRPIISLDDILKVKLKKTSVSNYIFNNIFQYCKQMLRNMVEILEVLHPMLALRPTKPYFI